MLINETGPVGRLQSRRRFMSLLVGAVGLSWAGAAAAQQCFDRSKLSAADLRVRQSLNFKDRSSDPKRACGGCTFFSGTQTCGHCVMLSGGPVEALSVCDSWTAKG